MMRRFLVKYATPLYIAATVPAILAAGAVWDDQYSDYDPARYASPVEECER